MTESSDTSPRSLYEACQNLWRASYAVRECENSQRQYPQSEHTYRTAFQRDRDRIIHCSAFRRLDFKTQVFVPHEDDHMRTRMTHTLEVAQIARTLSRALRLNEDLSEAVALAHDLGHPPFGHSGEKALDELMAEHGHFEHNRQSLRVVDYLEHPYPQFRGLNLTDVVRECIAKHETRYDTPVCEQFDNELHPPLEGQIVDLADEIAYTSADLEDSLAQRAITVEQLADLDLWKDAWELAHSSSPDARSIHLRIRAVKAVVELLAGDLLEATGKRLQAQGIDSLQAVRNASGKLVGFSQRMADKVSQLQDFLLYNVYKTGQRAELDRQACSMIRLMFVGFVQNPSLLPDRYSRRADTDGLRRVICDYIAGMTDRFCKQQYSKMLGE